MLDNAPTGYVRCTREEWEARPWITEFIPMGNVSLDGLTDDLKDTAAKWNRPVWKFKVISVWHNSNTNMYEALYTVRHK